MGCDAVSLGYWLPTFRRNVPHSLARAEPWKLVLSKRRETPSDTASQPIRPQSSTALQTRFVFVGEKCVFCDEISGVISGFRRDIYGICVLLGYYAASCENPLPTFRENIGPILNCQDPWPLKMGPIRFPETSVKDYHSTRRNTPEEGRTSKCSFHNFQTNFVLQKVNKT